MRDAQRQGCLSVPVRTDQRRRSTPPLLCLSISRCREEREEGGAVLVLSGSPHVLTRVEGEECCSIKWTWKLQCDKEDSSQIFGHEG